MDLEEFVEKLVKKDGKGDVIMCIIAGCGIGALIVSFLNLAVFMFLDAGENELVSIKCLLQGLIQLGISVITGQ